MRYLWQFYARTMKTALLRECQYRVALTFYTLGMLAEPVIYLVVWSTVAQAQGGTVGGYTAGGIAAYYIIWTLVRTINIVYTPYGWEGRIQRGQLSAMLLRPLHPIHYDLAFFAGSKLVSLLIWLPIAAALTYVFHPLFLLSFAGSAVFVLALVGAYLLRSMFLWALGMVSIWTTRVGAIYELFFACELLLSGRMVPMALLPEWVQHLAYVLPFQWTFSFPIEALIGQLSPAQLFCGLGMQLLWSGIGLLLVWLCWRVSIRHFSAVGN